MPLHVSSTQRRICALSWLITLYILCVLFVVNVSCDAATGCQTNCG